MRIPDIVLVRTRAQPEVLTAPPLLVVEIVSPDDSYSDTQRRANDYLDMGVETIWIIDPETRAARVCSGTPWTQASRMEVPGTPLFAELGELLAGLLPGR